MTIIYIPNFDTLDFELELSMLGEHRKLLEEHLSDAVRKEERVREGNLALASKEKTFEDYLAASQIANEEANHAIELYRRIFRAPFIIALWAYFESSLLQLADLIQSQKGEKLSIEDFKGDVLTRAWLYFRDVLDFPLGDDGTKSRLTQLYQLRCGLAHSNGHLSLMDKRRRAKVEKLVKHRAGLELAWDRVLMTREFLEGEHLLVERIVKDLLQRYSEFENAKPQASSVARN